MYNLLEMSGLPGTGTVKRKLHGLQDSGYEHLKRRIRDPCELTEKRILNISGS